MDSGRNSDSLHNQGHAMPIGCQGALHEKHGFIVGLVKWDCLARYLYGGRLGLSVYIYKVLQPRGSRTTSQATVGLVRPNLIN